MSEEHKWIPVTKKVPWNQNTVLVLLDSGEQFTAWFRRDQYTWFLAGISHMLYGVTHWQPLPEPPPKPDAFEIWWKNMPFPNYGSPPDIEAIDGLGHGHVVYKNDARDIWDAAIASTKLKP